MRSPVHFISGLPRSGSTLLGAILRQNPKFRASMSSPVAQMFLALLANMGANHELSHLISNDQRKRILKAVMCEYHQIGGDTLIFDTNRIWCSILPLIADLYPDSYVICCVRNPAWIIDSVERHVQRNLIQPTAMFGHDPATNVYTRVESMLKNGLLGSAMRSLRQAWYGEHANRLIVVQYESLVTMPLETMAGIYDAIGEPRFMHDYDHVEYDAPEVDAFLKLPGFHRISGKVEKIERETILPPDIFSNNDHCFWKLKDQNPRNVCVL